MFAETKPRSRYQSPQKLRQTYRISVIEGIFAQVYGSFCNIGSSFITKLLVILGASPMHYSLLSSLGQVSALFQPLGLAITHRLKRRKWACVWVTAVGRFLTFFLGFALVFRDQNQGISFALSLLFVSAALQAMGGNIWIAWMSRIIPLKIRGRFFSRRTQILSLVSLVVGYIVSFHFDIFENASTGVKATYVKLLGLAPYLTKSNQLVFLAAVFGLATALGMIGLVVLARQGERGREAGISPSLWSMYRMPFGDKNFRLLLVFGIWWMLSIGVGSAFWTPFMLKKLQMGLFDVQLYGSLHMLSSLLSYSLWGSFVDRFGNKTAMKICVFLGGLNPLMWLFMSSQNHHILWLEALSSGFMWAGVGIVTTNFVLAISPKGSEQAYSGIYNAIVGLSMMSSTLLSGLLYPSAMQLGRLYLEPEQVIFGVGAIMRWLTIIPLMLVVEKGSVPLRQVFLRVRTKFNP